MHVDWANRSPDPGLLSSSQDFFPTDVSMSNVFEFDDSLLSFNETDCLDSKTPCSGVSNSLDYLPQKYCSTSDGSLDYSNNAGLTIAQLSESPTHNSVSPPSDLPSGMGYASPVPALLNSRMAPPPEEWLLNPLSGEVTQSTEYDVSKRNRGDIEDDISACWRSPLCPNKHTEGNRPDTCHGECAAHLFAHPSELPEDKKVLADMMAKSEPKIIVEPTSSQGHLKRPSTTKLDGRDIHYTVHSPSPSEASSVSTTTPASDRRKKSTSSRKYTTIALSSPPEQASKSRSRVPHNQVEKKYRENVNSQLDTLRRAIPSQNQSGPDGLDMEDLGSSSRQPSKAAVLSSATAYIKQLEKDNLRMIEEMKELKVQNVTLQSLVKCEDCSLMNYTRNWRIGTQD